MTRYMIWAIIGQEATEFPGKAHYKLGEIRLSKKDKKTNTERSKIAPFHGEHQIVA